MENKKTNKIGIAIILATAVIVILLLVYITSQIIMLAGQGAFSKKQGAEDLTGRETNEDAAWSDKETEEDIERMDKEADADYWDEYKNEKDFEVDEDFRKERENYAASQITGPYYEEIVNCIDESVSYQIKREFCETIDRENGANMQASYIQLEGDIPNLENVNETIKEQSLYYYDYFLENEESFTDLYEEYGAVYDLTVESYVTFNDEDMISIAVESKYEYLYGSVPNIYGINVNLKTGTVLKNTEILDVDEEFVEEFCKRSIAQNGEGTVPIEATSSQDKLSMLQDNTSLIVFYTPIGLEVGFNYLNVEYTSGWITISLEDYEQYLKAM